jgi:hypothetical protein
LAQEAVASKKMKHRFDAEHAIETCRTKRQRAGVRKDEPQRACRRRQRAANVELAAVDIDAGAQARPIADGFKCAAEPAADIEHALAFMQIR